MGKKAVIYKLIMTLAAVVIIMSFAVYCFTPGKNSDYVEGVLWADATLHSGRLLDPDFSYAYAIPFGSNLLMLPFVKLFGICQLANSCGMLLMYVIMVATFLFFVRQLTGDWTEILAGTAVLILAFRSFVGMDLLHHVLYYQLCHVCLLGMLGAILHLYQRRNQKKASRFFYIAILLLYGVWSGANGVVSVVLGAFPVFFALAILAICNKSSRREWLKYALMAGAAVLIGLILYCLAMRGVTETDYIENTGTYVFRSIHEWIENLRMLPEKWLTIFLLNDPEGIRVTSFQGMVFLFSICWGVFLAIVPLFYIGKLRKKRLSETETAVFTASVAVWGVCLMQFVLFRGSELRLLLNAVLINFALLCLLFVYKRGERTTAGRYWYAEMIAGVLLALYSLLFVVTADWHYSTAVTDRVLEEGLPYGFGTFWNANYYTVQSSDAVKIRPVELNNGSITPMPYQSRPEWYEIGQLNGNDWFFVLTDEEYETLKTGSNSILFETCVREFEVEDEAEYYHVMVFPADMMNVLFENKGFIYTFNNEEFSRDCQTSDQRREIMDGGVSFGPYINVPAGQNCKVEITGKHLKEAKISAYSFAENTVLEPDYELVTDNKIIFFVRPDIDLTEFEVSVENASDDDFTDPIILDSETVKAF